MQPMSLSSWRRFHAHGFTANILERAPQTYIVAACDEMSGMTRQLPRTFSALEAAKAAADALVRRTFGHRCATDQCSDWAFWHITDGSLRREIKWS
jgi:hypothetical protein